MVSADIQIILDSTQFSWPMIITSGLILGVLSIVFVASRAARKEQNEQNGFQYNLIDLFLLKNLSSN